MGQLFQNDTLAEDAVRFELVSGSDSLLTAKFTGKFANFEPGARFTRQKRQQHQYVAARFPMQLNSEFLAPNSEFKARNSEFQRKISEGFLEPAHEESAVRKFSSMIWS